MSSTCPKCGNTNISSSRFCSECGANLAVKCPRCSTENMLGVKFCVGCGINFNDATMGYNQNRSQRWADWFGDQGFGVHPSWIEALNHILQHNGNPLIGEHNEIKILPLLISSKDAWIRLVECQLQNNKIWMITKGLLLITNCRIFLLEDETNDWGTWSLECIEDIQPDSKLTKLSLDYNTEIRIHFSPPKPGIGSFMLAVLADSVTKTRSGGNAFVGARSEIDAIHREVLKFFVEIVQFVKEHKHK